MKLSETSTPKKPIQQALTFIAQFKTICVYTFLICSFLTVASCANKKTVLSNDVVLANKLIEEGNFDDAQIILLPYTKLENDTTASSERLVLFETLGFLSQSLGEQRKSTDYYIKAVTLSRVLKDSAKITNNLWNLALVSDDVNQMKTCLEEIIKMARSNQNTEMLAKAYGKLGFINMLEGNYKASHNFLNLVMELSGISSETKMDNKLTQATLYLLEGNHEESKIIFESISDTLLNHNGKRIKYRNLSEIYLNKGLSQQALSYRDSVEKYSLLIALEDKTNAIDLVKERFERQLDSEKNKFNVTIIISIALLITIVILVCFFANTLKSNKKKRLLTEKISELNLQLSNFSNAEEEDKDNESNNVEKSRIETDASEIVLQKLRLTEELFLSSADSTVIKKLKLKSEPDVEERKFLRQSRDSIIGFFSDIWQNLRILYPSLTTEDCLYLTLLDIGGTNSKISVLMSCSNEALRQRKSRIKHKLPSTVFQRLCENR